MAFQSLPCQLIFFNVMLLAFVEVCAQENSSTANGIMAFGWGANFQETPALELPYVDGMSAYFGWRDLQPEEDTLEFSTIDVLVRLAHKQRKKINIGVYPGSHTPGWVYRKGAQRFRWTRTLKEDQRRKRGRIQEQAAPYPWDPVYLGAWKGFVAALVDNYKDNPSVGYFSLTGPTIRDLSTGILLKSDADWRRFVDGVDIENELTKSWIEIIEYYEQINNTMRYSIALGPLRPGVPDVAVAERILEHIINSRYTNISVMCVFLNDTWFEYGLAARRIRDLLKRAKLAGFNIGYQMAQSAERNRTWTKDAPIVRDLRKALQFGLADGMDWVEIWHDDIIDRTSQKPNLRYKADISEVHQKLK